MKSINLKLDPKILASVDKLAHKSHRNRSEYIRDSIYRSCYNSIRHGLVLESAPSCGPIIADTDLRVVAGKMVKVDSDGLLP